MVTEKNEQMLIEAQGRAVFLSYASEDSAAAERIATALRGADVEVWFDRAELRGGDVWDQRIRQQIHDCQLFIAVLSANTQARDEGYFRREWKLAVDRTHDMAEDRAFLLPVVIDDTSERSARVPEKFLAVQWARLPNGQTGQAFVERVQRLVSPSTTVQSGPPGTSAQHAGVIERPRSANQSVTHSGLRRRRLLLLTAVLIACAGTVYFAIERSALMKRSEPVVSAGEKSIAVLPFIDLSEKHDQEYFADGMAEEILDILAKVPSLRVIGRTSSFQFKGKTADLRAVGTSLGAGYVLEGSVRKSADRVRVTAQLIETRDGTHVWSETYDRTAEDTLLVQEEIATRVARSLEIGVGADRPQSDRRQQNQSAYDLYLRGRYAAERGDADGLAAGATYLRQALDADPTFADAAVALALTHYSQAFLSVEPSSAFELARHDATLALRLNPSIGLAHAILGGIHTDYDWDWAAAGREFQQALVLAPHDGRVLTITSDLTIALNQLDTARKNLKQALTYDPLLADAYASLAWVEWYSGRYDQMQAASRKVLAIDPDYDWGHTNVGIALIWSGHPAQAISEIERQNSAPEKALGLALAYQALGRADDSNTALRELIASGAMNYAYEVAEVYANRGDLEQALRWLERAYVQKDGSLVDRGRSHYGETRTRSALQDLSSQNEPGRAVGLAWLGTAQATK